MVYLKQNPVGIDRPIQALQQELEATLNFLWGMGDNDYQCYGRAKRNQQKGGNPTDYVPQVFTTGNDFKTIAIDDSAIASSFFYVGENTVIDSDLGATATVSAIFFVNMQRAKPFITGIADEEVRSDVFKLMHGGDFKPSGIITGIANVFKEFAGWKDVAALQFRDMSPYHCFRIDTKLFYDPLQC